MKEMKFSFDRDQTRRDFLILAGTGMGSAVVSLSILGLFGCAHQRAAVFPLADKLLVADASRCTGCQRCEITCTTINDGKVQPFISRITVGKNYNFGKDGLRIDFMQANGQYGNLQMTPITCKQCREPFCKNICPVDAIFADTKNGNVRTVNADICIGCGSCVAACPWHALNVDTETGKAAKCILCGACAEACPTGALSVIPWEDVKVAMNRRNLLHT
jgi:Fe-S-cluster-containing dehydrogenase component